MTEVIGVGAGGHARVVIEILQLQGQHVVVGLLDARKDKVGSEVVGVRVLGDDALLPELHDRGIHHAFIGLGTVGIKSQRRQLCEKVSSLGFQIVSAVHPSAYISRSAEIGEGATVMAAAVINTSCRIGDNVIVNTGAIIEHDCVIGSHVHVATGACLSGTVSVGTGTHIGTGAVVRQGISIGENSVVAAGAVVVHDVPDNVVVMGVPAKIYKKV